MANSNASEENNAAKNLELAIALVEEDNVDELETIVEDSLDEISGKIYHERW